MSIKLRPYQQEAIETMFGNPETEEQGLYDTHRFSAVFLPTGGGKSFVGMETMDRIMEHSDDEFVMSDTPMLYLSPNTGIIYQYQLHMAEHMIFEHHIDYIEKQNGKVSEDNIVDRVEEVLKKFSETAVIDRKEIEEFVAQHSDLEVDAMLRKALKHQLGKQSVRTVNEGVKKAFPNLKFKCYQAMRSSKTDTLEEAADTKDESEKLFFVEDIDAEFVILDEAHRAGAKEWKGNIGKLVSSHKKSKFLAITATPERDADTESIIDDIAKKVGYTTEERREKKYVAKDYRLIDAMVEGKVVTPDVIHFSCTLDQTKEYQEVRRLYEEAKKKSDANYKNNNLSNKTQTYKVILDRMHQLMGRQQGMTDEAWAVRQQELISQQISQSGLNVNGKYIAFIPQTPLGETPLEVRTKEHISSYSEKINNLLGNITDEVYAKGYHSAYTERENQDTLQEFVSMETDRGPAKVLITCQKLNEGVHVDSTEGLFMFDEIGNENSKTTKNSSEPKIRFLQEIGRCITSIDPEHPERTAVPKIFDFAHNFMRQSHLLLTRDGEPYFDIPQEQKEFLSLYSIAIRKPKAYAVIMGNSKSMEEAKERGKLKFTLTDGTTVDFPPEEPLPVRRKIDKPVTGSNETYVEAEKKALDVSKLNTKIRYGNLLTILTVLRENGIDTQKLDSGITLSKEFLKANGIEGEKLSSVLNQLYEVGARTIVDSIDKTPYPIGSEMKFFREAFFGVKATSATRAVFKENADVKKLSEVGILYIDLKNIPEEFRDKIDSRGFIKPNEKIPEEFFGINIQSGTRYFEGRDEFGCDESGYDALGYDKDGFNKDGIHRITGTTYDERFFFKSMERDPKTGQEVAVWRNARNNNSEVDKLGYNHDGIDPVTGFDRGRIENGVRVHYWHKLENGVFSRRGTLRDENGINFYGFDGKNRIGTPSFGSAKGHIGSKVDFNNFDAQRKNNDTDSYYNYDGRDIEGFDQKGFDEKGISIDTSYEYGLDARDSQGNLHPDIKLCQDIVKELLTRKMTPDEICKKFRISAEIMDERLGNALTIYGMSPSLREDPQLSRVTQSRSAVETLTKLSPKMHKQYIARTQYKLSLVQELEKQKERCRQQGKESQKELQEISERIRKIQKSSIVRASDDELEL